MKTAADADRVMQIVRGYLPAGQTVDNRLSVASSIQVNLRVRIAEMSRNLVRQLGVNWEALGNIGTIGKFPVFPALTLNANKDLITPIFDPRNPLSLGGNFNALIDALAQDELVHILAQPNLTAVSGEAASFLVGGEFPIPVAQQNNQVTVEFKQFGVSLAFVPTVASDGQITLKVRPEVSQLSNQNAFQLTAGTSVLVVPSLIVRRAETTVQLGSGESFAIAGLLQDIANVAGSGLPIMGDVPILGALFRSDKFQRNETELVIVVTPVHRPTGRQPDGAAPAHRRMAAAHRPRADPAAAPERKANRQPGGSEPGVAAHPRQCRIHRAMTEWPACSSLQLLCLAALVLVGCDALDPYRREGTWRPNGANEANLRVMVASPADLVQGVGSAGGRWPAGRRGLGSLQRTTSCGHCLTAAWQR